MNNSTHRTFILMALVVVILLFLHLLPPLTIGDVKFRPVSVLSDVSDSPLDDKLTEVIPKPIEPKLLRRTGADEDSVVIEESWPKGVQKIVDFSNGKPGGMSHFYDMLKKLSHHQKIGRPVRIAYYGDSFIEGDMMLANLRELMQAHYGGEGVGWVDAGNSLAYYRLTVNNKFKGLTEHMVMKRNTYRAADAGLSERYYPLAGTASMYIYPRGGYPHLAAWNNTRLYMLSSSPASVTFKSSYGNPMTKNASPSSHIQVVECGARMTDVTVTVNSAKAVLYSVALESDNGIIVDNFSVRGSAGISLQSLSKQTLRDFASVRPYDLIIFQYGVNAVSERSNDDTHKNYIRHMKAVVEHFKECFPKASILVMSTPDRGTRSGGVVTTMKGIESLVGYQEELAAETHVGFYNLFAAMGGRGSMGRLVDEGLANKDFVHLKVKGGERVAKCIFDSFSKRKETIKHD